MGGKIPFFSCGELDLGLYNRKFATGTVIKLYSYDLPAGSRSVISRDLNQSINEYLFNPALPIYTIDKPERYPRDRARERHLYGLKRRLEEELEEEEGYVEQSFSDIAEDSEFGRLQVTCYIFKPRMDGRTAQETRETIRQEFFKNNMSVLFSINGQVQGHYTSEFITRSLKFPLLRDCLLIHVECTSIHAGVRNELFMASRDRLKEGKESRDLRRRLTELLARGRLKEIHKERKASITVESGAADELLRNITRNLPIRDELKDLLSQTFKLDDNREGKQKIKARETIQKEHSKTPVFSPERYPSFFKINVRPAKGEEIPMVQVPIEGERTIKFSTDVEDQYFDRVEDAGELQIGLLEFAPNENTGGNRPGLPKNVKEVLNVVKSSPCDGVIRVLMKPTKEVEIGDALEIKASLSSPKGNLEQIFMVRIAPPEKKKAEPKKGEQPDNRLGLPQLHMVYKDTKDDCLTWSQLEEKGISMEHNSVVFPLVEGETLSDVYVNMDSNALLSHRAKLKKEEAITVANKRYVSAVYFHTLFLYTITRNRKYEISQNREGRSADNVDITDYISDLFETFYAQFLLNFDMQELIAALEA